MIRLFNAVHRDSVNQRFRQQRFRFFRELIEGVKLDRPIRVLDVGGTQSYWENMDFTPANVHFTLFNLMEQEVSLPNFTSLHGDATNLAQFQDGAFDLVHSNSVIEHLFTWDAQVRMAREVMRVGKRYYVQTPNRFFPIEPHWVFPLFQFLPLGLRISITERYYLDTIAPEERRRVAEERVKEVRLLTEKEMKALFPGAGIYREIFLGLKKSITAYSF